MSNLKFIIILLLVLILQACASTSANVRSLINVNRIEAGMTKTEVQNILGEQIVIGYDIEDRSTGNAKPIVIKNPYRAEMLNVSNKTYDVAYYLTAVKQPDGMITDDELTPCVFEKDKLVAKGWYELEKLRKR